MSADSMSTPVRIAGIGSCHGVDQAGWRVIEELERCRFGTHYTPGLVSMVCCSSPAALPSLLAGARLVVLVDALGSIRAGEVRCVKISELAPTGGYTSHGFDVGQAIELVESLPDCPARITLLGIGVDVFDTGILDPLPEDFAATVIPALVPVIDSEIRQFLGACR
jgi:hydrogenase maturation protease